MKLNLKEDPREWRKFLLVVVLMMDAMLTVLLWRGHLPRWFYPGAQPLFALVLGGGLWRPGWFRGLYRAGMTASHFAGMVIGGFLLTVLFFVAVTPLGLLLRLSGRDLLNLRGPPSSGSCWQKCRPPGPFDRMF